MTPQDALAALRSDLAAPPVEISVADLCGHWQMDWLRFVCDRPPLLEDHPELAVRIRGAFGAALAETGPPRLRSGRSLAAPYDALFSTLARTAFGEIPKPIVVRAAVSGDVVIIDLGLIGMAGAWTDCAAEAMSRALAGGIALRGGGRRNVPLVVREIGCRRDGRVTPAASISTATFVLRTPVVIRAGGHTQGDPRSIVRSTIRRTLATAAWQGVRVKTDTDALGRCIDAGFVSGEDLLPYRFERYSRRQGDAAIPVHGALGKFIFVGDLTPIAQFLAIGALINLGSHAALGLGHVDIVTTP